jgi:Sec-independent protein translocase protein TatA
MAWWAWIIIVLALVILFLPPRYDPAIRLKESVMRRRQSGDEWGD